MYETLGSSLPVRLRRVAAAHTAAVAVIAAVGGLFVHGQSAYLVAWTYTGGAVALPALLVNWMIARREIGSMPGGRAWLAGLVCLYLDGLGLLYLASEPGSPLRLLAIPAVLPPIALFAVAAVELARQRKGRDVPHSRVLGLAGLVLVVVGVATGVALAGRLGSSDSAWLLQTCTLVAVTTTAGAVASARYQPAITGPARALGRCGLAALTAGAVNSWAMLAQIVSDFSLPVPPLLALQAVTMGLLLQIPLHAPRQASRVAGAADAAGPAGASPWPNGPSRLSRAEIVSRAWFAEDPTEDGVLPLRLRRPAVVYLAATVPLLGLAGLLVHGRSAFLVAWVYASAAYTTPAMVVTWAASRRTLYQASAWRLWFLAVVALYLDGAGLLLTALVPGTGLEPLAVVAVLPCVGLFGAASIAMMRARSGSRSLGVDVVETAMVTMVICFGVLLLVGDRVWRADEAWFTVPTAVVTVAVTSGLAWTLMIYTRMPHENRALERVGLALALVGTIDTWAMLDQGLSGFTLPSSPLLMLQGLAMGLLMLLPLYVPRRAPRGLDQLPPHEQVRNSWTLVALTLAALPVLFVQASLARDSRPWAPTVFIAVLAALLFLAMARQAMAISETRNLYQQVVRAADERRRLLADVMRTVDSDRHRVAAQLHEQAIASYAAFASLNTQVERMQPHQGTTLLAEVSARLRGTFGDQAESLRRLMLAMQPLEGVGSAGPASPSSPASPASSASRRAGSASDRLDSAVRAYVDSLYGDAAAPDLRVEVADGLALAWTTEAIVLRVVQEAIGNVRRHAGARRIDVRLGTGDDLQLTLSVSDDGCGFDPAVVVHERGIVVMRSFASLIEATLTIDSRPGAGTTVWLRERSGSGAEPAPEPGPAPGSGPAAAGRSRLRLVRPEG